MDLEESSIGMDFDESDICMDDLDESDIMDDLDESVANISLFCFAIYDWSIFMLASYCSSVS